MAKRIQGGEGVFGMHNSIVRMYTMEGADNVCVYLECGTVERCG